MGDSEMNNIAIATASESQTIGLHHDYMSKAFKVLDNTFILTSKQRQLLAMRH